MNISAPIAMCHYQLNNNSIAIVQVNQVEIRSLVEPYALTSISFQNGLGLRVEHYALQVLAFIKKSLVYALHTKSAKRRPSFL